jgi:hypothetical protein
MSITLQYNPSNYADLSKLIGDVSYSKEKHINVKKYEHSYVLKYDKLELTDENVHSLGLFRSIIVDEDGNILSFAPPKSVNLDVFTQTTNYDECSVQHFPEGTMVNVFFDKITDEWEIATRSTIGAKCNFNADSTNTYRYMFLDAMNHGGIEFEHLNKLFCYSFVLQHPQNRIVCPVLEPTLVLTNCYQIDSENMITEHKNPGTDLNMHFSISQLSHHYMKDEVFAKSLNYNGSSWQELIEHFQSENLDYGLQGIVIYNQKGERTKIRNSTYEKIKHLKGNSPKLQYNYYYLRQTGDVKEYLTYYPEHKVEFSSFRRELHKWTNQLYQNYIKCFIKKQKPLVDYPYNFKTHMYKIHELYLNDLKLDGKFVNKNIVINYVNTLPPPRLMYSVNHIKKQYDKDQKTLSSDLKVIMKT